VPADDQSIGNDTRLFRRLHPTQIVWDDNQGRLRPTSNAFKDPSMSVALGDEMESLGLDPEWVLRGDPQHHLAWISAQLAREHHQAVWRDELVDHPKYGDDPTHGIVEGRKKGARASAFAKRAVVEIVRAESLKPEDRLRYEAATGDGAGSSKI
jgi:hypothetical protein